MIRDFPSDVDATSEHPLSVPTIDDSDDFNPSSQPIYGTVAYKQLRGLQATSKAAGVLSFHATIADSGSLNKA